MLSKHLQAGATRVAQDLAKSASSPAVRSFAVRAVALRGFSTAVRAARTAAQQPTVVVAPPSPGSSELTVKQWLRERQAALLYKADARNDWSWLAGPTARTEVLKYKLAELSKQETANGGVLDIDTKTPSTIVSHGPGYLDEPSEVVVGLQTDAPLKRGMKMNGGWRVVKTACEAYGYELDADVEKIFKDYRKTHNQCVFDAYTPEMRKARSSKLLTGLPDAYGRGRIVGDYRRVALFGVDELIARKQKDQHRTNKSVMTVEVMREREELADQIKALEEMKQMAQSYGFDISKPATSAKEAVQWTYFPYLATVKANDGAATSLPRLDLFFDAYIEADLKAGKITEAEAQELIDQFVLKLRMVKHLRTPEYNSLFSGDPTWATLSLAGSDATGEPLVSKTSYRFLQTLYNLGRHPEPNLTVLWNERLPEDFKQFCAKVSAETSSVQYENDDLMRPIYGDDVTVACCVSGMATGEQMQFFGARCNLPKLLLYSINGGVDEVTGKQVGPKRDLDVVDADGYLDYDKLMRKFDANMDWIAALYANTMNVIHWSHDKYFYEALQMALHETDTHRWMAFGASGIATVADSLAAVKYGKIKPVRDANGVATDFELAEGYNLKDLPTYGTDDDRADDIVRDVVQAFNAKLKAQHTYRDSVPTLSLLTITSNVVYGKQTGTTPDGRKVGECFSPGGNPYHGRDNQGALASLNSVAKISYDDCQDGISNTFSVAPAALGKSPEQRQTNLVALLDGYFKQGGHHINVNVMDRDMLLDAMDHPENYPNLVVRISGYAVMFDKLTREQQMDIVTRTFHGSL